MVAATAVVVPAVVETVAARDKVRVEVVGMEEMVELVVHMAVQAVADSEMEEEEGLREVGAERLLEAKAVAWEEEVEVGSANHKPTRM